MHSEVTAADIHVFHHMVSVRRLSLSYNSLHQIYDSMFASMSQLVVLDLSHNSIKYLPQITLCSLHNLQYISLHHNLITEFLFSIFVHNPSVQVVLLESNNVNPLSMIIGDFLPSLYRLSSDIPRLCCAFKTTTFCSPPFPLLVSCSNLITSTVLIVLGWLIGSSTSFLSLICLVLQIYKLCNHATENQRAVTLFSMNLTLAELVTSLCLLSYSVINVVFHDVFGIFADQWRHSWKCLGLESVFSLSSRASLAFAVCLSVHFVVHIPSVSQRKSSLKATIFQILLLWLLITCLCIALQILEYMRNIDPFNYFCFPFSTLFPSDPLILSFQIALLIIDIFLVMVTIVSYGYLLVFTIKRRRNQEMQYVSKRKEKLQRLGARFTVLILSTVFTWIPILCVQILVLMQVTILPNIYFWCILVSFPINLTIDPILLIRNILA